ncbi:Mitochondrial thiamine pyrophosphate carrier [Nymphon striatum]|nr:Mitochondrial thiamine pyrophosphate carrier [Nymphon striatum]
MSTKNEEIQKDTQTKQLSHKDHALAGGISGVLTRLFCQPFDVIKIRFQLQVEPINKNSPYSKYTNILQAFRTVVKDEGIFALWKGHVPAQGLSFLFASTQFPVYKAITNYFLNLNHEHSILKSKPIVCFVSGGIAGCCATVVCQPFDVIRTRLVSQGEPKIYKGLIHATVKMYKHEGLLVFYKGLTPTLLQIVPNIGSMFAFYEGFCSIWEIYFHPHLHHVGISESAICGFMAGICSKALVHPLDLVKKRLQVQGFHEGRTMLGSQQVYSGFLNCLRVILKTEGLIGMYKGLRPSILKAAVTTACHFTFYEQACNLLKLKYIL